ncbi:MAG: FAD-dependent oxidoreductase [Alphaproteobacteria bacterium]|nr:FAD-dependent oxidoreductase [Alphaproteobacteria bacterium]
MADLPGAVRVVIVGGGIIGCSVAYHLARLGWRDIVLLERKQLSCGTTWHAAGLVRSMLYTVNLTRLAQYTAELYLGLEAETGQATGYKRTGSVSIATNAERFEEILRGASMARAFSVAAEQITAAEAVARWPLLDAADVVGAVWFPQDGQTNPSDTCAALAKGARAYGARIIEGVKVTGMRRVGRRVTAVETPEGAIACEVVINCAGLWAREVGLQVGVNIPLHACEHFYVVTEPVPGLPANLPMLRDMDGGAYYKEDAGKLLVGGFELTAKPWGIDGIPEDFCFDQLPDDWDHFAPILEGATRRVPVLQRVGIRTFFNGPESFTPDQRYHLGPVPELDNYFVAAGFNSIGIQSAGGAGRALAEWVAAGEPPFDLWEVDVRRVMPHQGRKHYLVERVSEALGLLYAMHWPYRQYETARGIRTSPLHEALAARGACFGEVAGWERPNWYAPAGVAPRYRYSYGRQNWFSYCAAECRAAREAVALFDLSSFAKFDVSGPDAEALLQRLSANDIGGPHGRVVYTQWLNELGGIEADLTVSRLDADRFFVVTSSAQAVRDWGWINRHASSSRVALTDVTSAWAVIGIMGPGSRALLQELTAADLGPAAFPFATWQSIVLGPAAVRAVRISYVGELGWELYVPTEFARALLAAILAKGEAFGLRPAGFHALDSLRLEKGYRHWGHDITAEDSALGAGLGFACAFGKDIPFIGREALLAARAGRLSRRLVCFALEAPEPLLYRNEPIYRDGALVGLTTSGAYGHTLGRAVALGWVQNEGGVDPTFIAGGRFEIEIAGRRHPARASLRPFYDPTGARLRS